MLSGEGRRQHRMSQAAGASSRAKECGTDCAPEVPGAGQTLAAAPILRSVSEPSTQAERTQAIQPGSGSLELAWPALGCLTPQPSWIIPQAGESQEEPERMDETTLLGRILHAQISGGSVDALAGQFSEVSRHTAVDIAKAFHAALVVCSQTEAPSTLPRASSVASDVCAPGYPEVGRTAVHAELDRRLLGERPDGTLHCVAGGIAGGVKVADRAAGIFYKIACDAAGLFGGSALMRAKPVKRESSVARHLLGCRKRGGFAVPLMSVTDVTARSGADSRPAAVYRVHASMLLPIGHATLRLGSSNAGTTINVCESLLGPARELAETLHLAPSNVQPRGGVVRDHCYAKLEAEPPAADLTALGPGVLAALARLGCLPGQVAAGTCARAEAEHGVVLDPRRARRGAHSRKVLRLQRPPRRGPGGAAAAAYLADGEACDEVAPVSSPPGREGPGGLASSHGQAERVVDVYVGSAPEPRPSAADSFPHAAEPCASAMAPFPYASEFGSVSKLATLTPYAPIDTYASLGAGPSLHCVATEPSPRAGSGSAPGSALSASSSGSLGFVTSAGGELQWPLPFDVEAHVLPSGLRVVVDSHRLLIPEMSTPRWLTGVFVVVRPDRTEVKLARRDAWSAPPGSTDAAGSAARAAGGRESVASDVERLHMDGQSGITVYRHRNGSIVLSAEPGRYWRAPHLTMLFPPAASGILRELRVGPVSPDDMIKPDGAPERLLPAAEALLGETNVGLAAAAVWAEVRECLADGGRSESVEALRLAVKAGLHARGLGLRHAGLVWSGLQRLAGGSGAKGAAAAMAAACLPRPGSTAAVALEVLCCDPPAASGLSPQRWAAAVIAARAAACKGTVLSPPLASVLCNLILRQPVIPVAWLTIQRGTLVSFRASTGTGSGVLPREIAVRRPKDARRPPTAQLAHIGHRRAASSAPSTTAADRIRHLLAELSFRQSYGEVVSGQDSILAAIAMAVVEIPAGDRSGAEAEAAALAALRLAFIATSGRLSTSSSRRYLAMAGGVLTVLLPELQAGTELLDRARAGTEEDTAREDREKKDVVEGEARARAEPMAKPAARRGTR